MAATLKLTAASTAELDLSSYLNVQEDSGLDPADGGFLEPAFNESSIGAGQALVNIDAQNKELAYPLTLKAATKDALHTLVRSIRTKLDEPGVRVEWRDDSASLSTFYDIEFGRLEPAYRYFRARQRWLGATLHVWARPYGHTATERIIGTAAGSGWLQVVSIPSGVAVAGDVSGLPVVGISAPAPSRDLYGYAVIPSGVITEWRAASIAAGGVGGTMITVGASGALGSQYRGIYATSVASANVANSYVAGITVPISSMIGNQRIFAVARVRSLQGAYMTAADGGSPSNNALGPTALLMATYPLAQAPAVSDGWQLVDLGVLRLAHSETRQANAFVNIFSSLASSSGASLLASPALHINALYVLPEDRTMLAVDQSNGRSSPASTVMSAVISESYGQGSAVVAFTAWQRGGFPVMAPGAGEQLAAFALGVTANNATAVELRVRERFSFQR